MPEVKKERTGWRDSALSQRHREWGFECPAMDLDFVLVECNSCKVKGLIEYKNEHAAPLTKTSWGCRILVDLADRANLPAFVCRYTSDLSWYLIKSLNEKARLYVAERKMLTEEEYVEFLYQLRENNAPKDILEKARERDKKTTRTRENAFSKFYRKAFNEIA